ncbi:MAG: hypothetical protein K2J77_11435 [Oscillospiraceae bacterium]|nr:hypothetical protein [Oscillospiraceae bacterium]
MKKFVIPIIAAAILGVGAGVTAVMMNRANVATADDAVGVEEVEVKSGSYYLNGDVDSGLWVVVTPETISLKGDDIDASMREAIAELYEEELSEEFMQENIDMNKLLYCEEKPYFAHVVNLPKSRCVISVERENRPVEKREDLLNTNAGFGYEDTTDTIHLSLFGDFTLVE